MASSAALHKLHIHATICPVIVHSFVPSPSSADSAIFVQIDMLPHNDDDEEAGPSTLTDSAQTQQVLCDGLSMENLRHGIVSCTLQIHIHPICPVIVRSFVPSPSSTDSAIFVQIDTMSPHDDDDEEARPSTQTRPKLNKSCAMG